MRRLLTYLLYGFPIALALMLSSCGSHRTLIKTAPAENRNGEKEIKSKYATLLGVPEKDIVNYPLYAFINDWYGVPYKYAGHSKAGVDCSDFVAILFERAYGMSISGTASDLFHRCRLIKESELKEGDLVFFRINSKQISHVGVYLQNNRFVHASVHAGVVISSLDEPYYRKYFYKAGKIESGGGS